MAIGFRKSLFGFNCDDVINYVKKLHSNFAQKENDLKKSIENLSTKIDELAIERENMLKEKTELKQKLAEYNAKKAEMERLSENIGKLYLVAQTNAKSIMSNAEENSRLANEEISKNITTIDETHEALRALRQSITETSENFTREVDALMQSLNVTKERITADKEADSEAKAEFSSVFEALTK